MAPKGLGWRNTLHQIARRPRQHSLGSVRTRCIFMVDSKPAGGAGAVTKVRSSLSKILWSSSNAKQCVVKISRDEHSIDNECTFIGIWGKHAVRSDIVEHEQVDVTGCCLTFAGVGKDVAPLNKK